MIESTIIITQTKKWLADVVIGCYFCPFAKKPFKGDSIHYEVTDSSDAESCLRDLLLECQRLDEHPEIETTLLIFPDGSPDFDDYLDLVAMAEDLLIAQDYDGVYQVAGFHPDYRFGDAPVDDPANYTNRSLYPMFHLIREESIDQALASDLDPDSIPEKNVAFARDKGLIYMKVLRDACF